MASSTRPAALASVSLAAEALVKPDGIDFEFGVGVLQVTADSEHLIGIAIIAEVGGRFLAAVPVKAWDKSKAKRVLPQPIFDRAVSAIIGGCTIEDREQPSESVLSVAVWVGYLKREFWSCVSFGGSSSPTIDFEDSESGDPCFPFAAGLVDMCVDKGLMPAPGFGGAESVRLQSLEEKFSILEKGMQELLSLQRGEGGFVSPEEVPSAELGAAPKRKSALKPKVPAAPPGLSQVHSFPGLDPSAVAAGLQAGIPLEQMQSLSQALTQKPAKLSDYPRVVDKRNAMVSESEDGEHQMDETGDNAAGEPEEPMAKAIVKLTEIMGMLAKKKSASLEDALDQVGGGSGLGDVSSSMGRKHAAARQALLKAYREDPKLIWSSVEKNMAEDFHLQSSAPNETALQFSARGWCEHRSRIQPYVRTVRWVWAIAGVLDNLREGNTDQARARCCLLLAAAEQESLDHGSFLLSQEMLMEPAAPMSSFQTHVLPDQSEMVTTRLIDPRWIEAFADRLKQLDNYVEMRKKLNLRSRPTVPPPPTLKTKGGGKGKEKGKTDQAAQEGWVTCCSKPPRPTPVACCLQIWFRLCLRAALSVSLTAVGVLARVFLEKGMTLPEPFANGDDPMTMHDVFRQRKPVGADTGDLPGPAGPDIGPNVPGARASTVRIHSVWHGLIRNILAGSTPFAIFYKTMLRRPLGIEYDSPTTCIWPMALPYSDFEDYNLDVNEEIGLRKLINVQVAYLNYLHLGRPSAAPRLVCKGAKLNDLQRQVVGRLQRLSASWHSTPAVEAGDMGRVAAKQERQEVALQSLSRLASDSVSGLKKYGGKPRRVAVARPSDSTGKVIGRMSRDDFCGAQTIVASRVKMEGKPVFDPNPFLDGETSFLYNNPFSMVPDDRNSLPPPPRVLVHADFNEKLQLLELLEKSNRLAFRRASDIIPGYGNGLFCVPKNTTTDRLILDGRPANLLQRPPGKFILSMASANTLCGVYLSDSEKLLMSGDDLSNFFYTFRVNDSRVSRNFLEWKIPVDIAKTFKSFPSGLLAEDFVYPCLCTLAMGDSAACDYAQTSHLSMGLQAGCFVPEQLVTLHGRIPRHNLIAGIIIDDFILLERVARDAVCGVESKAARSRMHDMYQRVGLEAHPTKGFANEEVAEFWGASVDGLEGLVRANVKRAISLVWVTSQVAKMQVCSVGLLEVLAGGFVSVFCFRRRMMSLLDLIYVMQAGRDRKDVVRLCPAAVDELWSLVVLAPLAVTDLRAKFADFIFMVDASNWGDAVVCADLKGGMSQEVHRHCAAKSAWTRLLSPFKSLLRGKGCLSPEEELPEGEESYSEHPVWETAARGLNYSLSWKAKAKDGRHINIGELRAYLKAESLGAMRSCDLRIPVGSDSQVCIGAICKGRSASGCLNALLRQSLSTVLGCGIYSSPGYIGSARNPADDPTRGHVLRVADVELPGWWNAAVCYDYKELDIFLSDLSLHPHQLAGYSDLKEISVGQVEEHDPILKRGLNKFHRKVKDDIKRRALKKRDSTVISEESNSSSFFTQDIIDCLASFGLEQFVFQTGKQWPPQEKGFLDLYSGKKGFAHAAVRYGAPWVLTVDFLDGPQCDLLDGQVRKKLEFLLAAGVFSHLSAAPICSSFSRAITPAVRDKNIPKDYQVSLLLCALKSWMGILTPNGFARSSRYVCHWECFTGLKTQIHLFFGSSRNGRSSPMVSSTSTTSVITARSKRPGGRGRVFWRTVDSAGKGGCAIDNTDMYSLGAEQRETKLAGPNWRSLIPRPYVQC